MRITEKQYQRYRFAIERLSEIVGLGLEPRATIKDAYSRDFLGPENIVGFGFGVKIVEGVPQDKPALCGFVVRKAPPEIVNPAFLIEELTHKYLEYNIQTDVQEVGRPEAFIEYRRRIPGGAAVRNQKQRKRNEGGTLGGWLTDPQEEIYLLSCWHCLDGGQFTPPNSLLIRHGNKDIAKLICSINPKLDRIKNRPTVDATIAKLGYGAKEGDFILQIGEVRGTKAIRAFDLPLPVLIYGAKSGLMRGTLENESVNIVIKMTSHDVKINANSSEVLYEQQLIIRPDSGQTTFSQPGDSGALVMTKDNLVVGLLVGGGKAPIIGTSYSIATPINEVLDRLNSKTGKSFKFLTYP